MEKHISTEILGKKNFNFGFTFQLTCVKIVTYFLCIYAVVRQANLAKTLLLP